MATIRCARVTGNAEIPNSTDADAETTRVIRAQLWPRNARKASTIAAAHQKIITAQATQNAATSWFSVKLLPRNRGLLVIASMTWLRSASSIATAITNPTIAIAENNQVRTAATVTVVGRGPRGPT